MLTLLILFVGWTIDQVFVQIPAHNAVFATILVIGSHETTFKTIQEFIVDKCSKKSRKVKAQPAWCSL
jgi:translation initiation factor 2 beta subunit (eIF-2beta)/eIF-5